MKNQNRLILLVLLLLGAAVTAELVAQTVYRYRCIRCGLVEIHTIPGVKNCPRDGSMMIRVP